MIAIAIKLLTLIGLKDEAAKAFAPVALIAAAFAGVFLYGRFQYGEGREAAQLSAEQALNDDLKDRMDAFLALSAVNQENYEKTLEIYNDMRGKAPQIIREIRDAPPTACSGEPISDAEWLWLRRAIDLRPADGERAGS